MILTPPTSALPWVIGTPRKLWLLILLFFCSLCLIFLSPALSLMVFPPQLLTDPFLQFPTANSVRVVWFTEFAGTQHRVEYGENGENVVGATTMKRTSDRASGVKPKTDWYIRNPQSEIFGAMKRRLRD
jgi:hypothetical protein